MSSDDISVDSDAHAVSFAFVDFTNVDFGSDVDDKNDSNSDHDDIVSAEKADETLVIKAIHLSKRKSFPGGQDPEEEHVYNSELFQALCRRVDNLVKWHELGIRPSLADKNNLTAHANKDEDLFQSSTDDMTKLLLRSIEAQDEVNRNLPPHPVADYETHLKVATSSIEDAGSGLFTTVFIPKGAVVCNYSGYRHHYQSQKRLQNRAYVLKLQNGWPKHDRRNDGFVDAFPCKSVLARFINDPRVEGRCNVKFEHIQEPDTWHCPVIAQRDIEAGEELFVSYGPRYWDQSRMIGG